MRPRRGAAAVAVAAGALCILAGAAGTASAESRPVYGGRAVASLLSAPHSLDPLQARSHAEVTLAGLVFDGLFAFDAAGQPVPRLAAGPPRVSADGLEARVPILAGVRFHDGRLVRPTDVVRSLKRAATAPATEWALAPVRGISTDGGDVVLALRRRTPELAALLALPQLAVTPDGRPPGAGMVVGSGPFVLRRVLADERRLELEAWAEHLAGRPYLERLALRWFAAPDEEARGYEAGDADVSARGDVAFAGHTPKHPTSVAEGPASLLVYVGFGRAHAEVLADRDFRRALSLAQNRGALRHVGAGERVVPALLPEAPDLGGAAPARRDTEARLDEAKDALRRAAARRAELERLLGAGGRAAISLEVLADASRPDDAELAARVVTALDRLGIPASFAALDPRAFARRVAAGDCDLYIGQLVAPSPELVHEYAAAFAAGGDRWAVRRMARGNLTRRAAQAAFAERLPVVPLLHRGVRAHHRRALRGLAFDRLGRIAWADLWAPVPSELGGPARRGSP